MKAVFEIEVPKSCMDCPVSICKSDPPGKPYSCCLSRLYTVGCLDHRHADCPLKIVGDDNKNLLEE
jgi:hypothetical protein